MKINGHPAFDLNGATQRLAGKAKFAAEDQGRTAADPPSSSGPAKATSSGEPPSPSAPATSESTVELAARKAPPGLVRVAARLEALGVDGRTAGQSNALTRIDRNLQRYADNQGAAAPPPSPTDASDAPADGASTAIPPDPTAAEAGGLEAST